MTSGFIPYDPLRLTDDEQLQHLHDTYETLRRRRSVREFSDRPVRREVIEQILRIAGSAPSGANKQPWHFVVVTDPVLKRQIREAAEREERENYERRMSDAWKSDLAPLGTDWHKPFLDIAPALIAVFAKSYDLADGEHRKNYYVKESVGIACGFLIAAIHMAGLVTLTHTPSPMDFLGRILGRPENEKPFLLLPVGYPAEGATVPDIRRKGLEEISEWR
ncbi:MAG: nitroreductase family protein [Bacteroidetes bacterium]|jgi:nitroreductase|nr:nitroreductase family protein [Bacteroidota bacterium]